METIHPPLLALFPYVHLHGVEILGKTWSLQHYQLSPSWMLIYSVSEVKKSDSTGMFLIHSPPMYTVKTDIVNRTNVMDRELYLVAGMT